MTANLRRSVSRVAWLVALAAILTWAWSGMAVDLARAAHGLRFAGEYLREMVPPDWSIGRKAWEALTVTLQMAVLGTFLGFVPAIPISFLAARTSALPRSLSAVIKTILNVLRAVPPLIYAIL